MIWLGILWLILGIAAVAWGVVRDRIRLATFMLLALGNLLIQMAYIEFGWRR